MTEFVDTYPTARTRHRCGLCHRVIDPGETYWRQAGLDHGRAWTSKTCEHCERVVYAYCRTVGESEWMEEDALDWLRDDHPAVSATLRAGWCWPDGELTPVPFGSRCVTCGARIKFGRLWCRPCDDARIDRLNGQFTAVRQSLAGTVAP